MKLIELSIVLCSALSLSSASPLADVSESGVKKRAQSQFIEGQPIDGNGKGGRILGMYFLENLGFLYR
jgi:hypothetical protein